LEGHGVAAQAAEPPQSPVFCGAKNAPKCGFEKSLICLFFTSRSTINPDVSAEVVKYLDIVDDTLVKQIAHAIQPALEKSIKRSAAKIRRYYERITPKAVKTDAEV
jgi:hypothetical protein